MAAFKIIGEIPVFAEESVLEIKRALVEVGLIPLAQCSISSGDFTPHQGVCQAETVTVISRGERHLCLASLIMAQEFEGEEWWSKFWTFDFLFGSSDGTQMEAMTVKEFGYEGLPVSLLSYRLDEQFSNGTMLTGFRLMQRSANGFMEGEVAAELLEIATCLADSCASPAYGCSIESWVRILPAVALMPDSASQFTELLPDHEIFPLFSAAAH
jgi:hypothetical protein